MCNYIIYGLFLEGAAKMEVQGVTRSVGNVEYVREHAFEVGPRYTNLAYIGEGAYGMVV